MSATTKAYLQLHLCVLLWGFTPILGRLITLDALTLVWWRMLLAGAALLVLPGVRHQLRRMPWRLMAAYAAIGVLLAISWLLFYGSIKLSNASVGAVCLAAAPTFLSVIEPLIAKRPINKRELLLGVALIPGMALIVGGLPADMHLGLIVGLVGAFFLAAFSALNKRIVERAGPMVVTGIEMTAGALFLTVLAPFFPHTGAMLQLPGLQDAGLLVFFAFGCTLIPFVLLMRVLRHVTAFTTQMATNLEPVYAIVLAIPLLGEQLELTPLFYIGVVMVIGAVIVQPMFIRRAVPGAVPIARRTKHKAA